jgi:hypothetical protein
VTVSARGWLRAAGAGLVVCTLTAACASAEKAAAHDPMKCERDPSCAKARGGYADCSRQCADNPECVDRCQQVQKQMDSLGH